MMRMDNRLIQTQTQRLMLTQKMQQALHILQLSQLELEQYVQQELETNPLIEQIQKEPAPEPQSTSVVEENGQLFDESFDLDAYAGQWDDRRPEGIDFSRNPDADARRQFYENSITQEESFSSRLLTQLRIANLDEQKFAIGERILGDIDGRGYFVGSLEEIAESLQVSIDQVEHVLVAVIQRFEPTGVGARDVVECLLLQIMVEFPDEPQLYELVENHLEDLERRQIPKIAKAMNITPERVEALKEMLAKLDPWPGHEYTQAPTQYVTPDVIVEKMDEEYIVYLSDERIPELHISDYYRQMSRDARIGKEERRYIHSKMESAKWLIHNIYQRQRTILRIAKAIVDVQGDFLEKGTQFLKPLTLQEIADKVGVHEATVSRTTRGKYMQTPQGLFEMKYFFSPGLRHESGDAQSAKSVQSLIETIINEEDKKHPLSDQKIANLLQKQGLNIARRTVTKYREAMGILSTGMRKQY